MNNKRELIISSRKRWIIKIGTSSLLDQSGNIKIDVITHLIEQIHTLQQQGFEIILVSSGAIVQGLNKQNIKSRPTSIQELQVAAAIGQIGLLRLYTELCDTKNIITAQVLLVAQDFSQAERALNLTNTMHTIIEQGYLALVNENDVVATEEICLGDNDNLAAQITSLFSTGVLVLMTDVDGIYQSYPIAEKSSLFTECAANDNILNQTASSSSNGMGTGGMISKIKAARLAATNGTHTVVCNSSKRNALLEIASGHQVGSLLYSDVNPIQARYEKFMQSASKGRLYIKNNTLATQNEDISPLDIIKIEGDFERGHIVEIAVENRVLARGLCNYTRQELDKIIGCNRQTIIQKIGISPSQAIYKNNLERIKDSE